MKIFVVLAVTCLVVLVGAGARWLIYARSEKATNACVNNLRLIASAKQQWGLEYKKGPSDTPAWTDLQPYIEYGSNKELPHCPDGGVYLIGRLSENPTCSIGGRNHMLPDAQ